MYLLWKTIRINRNHIIIHNQICLRCIIYPPATILRKHTISKLNNIKNIIPRSRGGLSTTENCVPACLSCNGDKSDLEALYWYRRQKFYAPRRAMAIRAWLEGALRLAIRLLQWVQKADHKRVIQSNENEEINLNAA